MMIDNLPPRTTLNGKWDAYCHVCWNAVYVLWADDEPPDYNKCAFGDFSAHTCHDAINRAKLRSQIIKLKNDGLIK
jgi:hypothetical protein